MLCYTPDSELDRDLFQAACLAAAESSTPSYIGEIAYDPTNHYEQWLAEGSMRTAVNKKIGTAHELQAKHQRIPGQALTVDELGRVCEGPVELLLGLDVAGVLMDSTDARPDKTVDGVRFDVKGSMVRPGNTFSLPCHKALKGDYDALILVQHVEPGRVRVWCCKCEVGGPSWTKFNPSQKGKTPFYRISCSMQ